MAVERDHDVDRPTSMFGERGGSSSCRECGAPLAVDQRYCVECGSRRGPLPAGTAALIATGGTGSPGAAATALAVGAAAEAGSALTVGWFAWFQSLRPSTIAAAVMSMLAFGVIVGAAVSPAEPSEASEPAIVAIAPSPPGASPTSSSPRPEVPPESAEPETRLPSGGSAKEPQAPAQASHSAPARAPSKSSTPTSGSPPPASALPPIKHVFVIVLSGQGYEATFGAESKSPYLSKTLAAQGELLRDYYAVTGGELANMIALISGQGPTPETASNCPQYAGVEPGTAGSEGQVLGSGCVYPQQTLTVADQMSSAGKSWKAYIGGMEEGASGQPKSCRHPELGSADPNQATTPGDPYVTWRNPFVYFQSLTGTTACSQYDVGLERLAFDLTSRTTTPSLAFIVPSGCQDGSEEPCAPGQPAGLGPADTFLESVVPEIERSAAYREGGLIAITSDEAPQSGPHADSSGCCLTSPYPNLSATSISSTTTTTTSTSTSTSTQSSTSTTTTTTGSIEPPGGGKVGLLLLSKYVKPGSVNAIGEYNHFSLLASIEDLFGLKPLGYAGATGILAFDTSVFNASADRLRRAVELCAGG